jgi:hypothetical protein
MHTYSIRALKHGLGHVRKKALGCIDPVHHAFHIQLPLVLVQSTRGPFFLQQELQSSNRVVAFRLFVTQKQMVLEPVPQHANLIHRQLAYTYLSLRQVGRHNPVRC